MVFWYRFDGRWPMAEWQGVWVKASTPAVDISSKEKEDVEECSS